MSDNVFFIDDCILEDLSLHQLSARQSVRFDSYQYRGRHNLGSVGSESPTSLSSLPSTPSDMSYALPSWPDTNQNFAMNEISSPDGINWSNPCSSRSRTPSTQSMDPPSPMFDGGHSGYSQEPEQDMFRPMPSVNQFRFPQVNDQSQGLGQRRLLPSQKLGLTPMRKKKPDFNFCVFCKTNDEPESFYLTHTLKDDYGRVRCPVLSRYVCPSCGATGQMAHTISYCPKSKEGKFQPQCAPITVLKEMRSSTGKERLRTSKTPFPPPPAPIGKPIQPLSRPILGQGSTLSQSEVCYSERFY